MKQRQTIQSTLFSVLLIVVIAGPYKAHAQKDLLQLIPSDALFVGSFHADDMNEKVMWETIRKYQVVEEAARQVAGALKAQDSEMLRGVLLNPKANGVDLSKRTYIFADIDPEELYLSMAFHITSPTKFRDLLKAYYGNSIATKIRQNRNYLAIYEDKLAISWFKDHAIITFFDAKRKYNEEDFDFNARKKLTLEGYVSKITQLDQEESIRSNSKFANWDNEVRDAGLWLDYSKMAAMLMDGLEQIGGMQSPYAGMNEFLPMLQKLMGNDEMYIASDISFDKGAILANTRTFAGETAMHYIESATSGKSNKRILNYLDGENTLFYFTNYLSPEGTYEGLKEVAIKKAGEAAPDAKKVVENLFGILEIFIDEKDAFCFLTGDLMFAINGVGVYEREVVDYIYNEDTDDYEEKVQKIKTPIPLFTFGLGYGDKKDMLKFLEIFETLGMLEKLENKSYQTTQGSFPTYIKLDKKLLVISNDSTRLVANKKYAKMDKAHKNYLKENMQTVYFNMEHLVQAIKKSELGEDIPKEVEEYIDDIENGAGNILLQTKRPEETDDYLLQTFELRLKNKEENSLKQLFDFINRIYLDQQTGI